MAAKYKYSSVLMLISLSSLATRSKFQKNFCLKMRVIGLININTKESKDGRHLRRRFIPDASTLLLSVLFRGVLLKLLQ